MFPNKFRNIFVAETMFPSLPTCFQVFPKRNIVFPIGNVQTMFTDYSGNINNTLRFVRANVSQKMFPNVTKHRQETLFP